MLHKYGRTLHLPQLPGVGSDDKIQNDLSILLNNPVVVTEKMDGENTTIHSGGCHPRSPDARYHPSRDWVKGFAAGISPQLSSDERIVGECLYARHSIAYDALASWFLGFAWIKDGVFQSWADTLSRFAELGVTPIINAAGTITTMGGSLMPAEVREAWLAASRQFVPLLKLQELLQPLHQNKLRKLLVQWLKHLLKLQLQWLLLLLNKLHKLLQKLLVH